jgi:hypothetical protein
MIKLCAPALIYLIFSITQILIDMYNGLYNTAGMKVIVMTMITLLLNILCDRGLSVVSWIIVFIPFILMTVIVGALLYIFGLDAATGSLHPENNTTCITNGITKDALGNIIIYDPNYNPYVNPVYYHSPNIIVPNPNKITSSTKSTTSVKNSVIPNGSSSPEYQS